MIDKLRIPITKTPKGLYISSIIFGGKKQLYWEAKSIKAQAYDIPTFYLYLTAILIECCNFRGVYRNGIIQELLPN